MYTTLFPLYLPAPSRTQPSSHVQNARHGTEKVKEKEKEKKKKKGQTKKKKILKKMKRKV